MGAKHSEFAKDGFRTSLYDEQDIAKEGSLMKKGRSGPRTVWRKREFVLSSHYLKYYTNEAARKEGDVTGVIDLSATSSIEANGKDKEKKYFEALPISEVQYKVSHKTTQAKAQSSS